MDESEKMIGPGSVCVWGGKGLRMCAIGESTGEARGGREGGYEPGVRLR